MSFFLHVTCKLHVLNGGNAYQHHLSLVRSAPLQVHADGVLGVLVGRGPHLQEPCDEGVGENGGEDKILLAVVDEHGPSSVTGMTSK